MSGPVEPRDRDCEDELLAGIETREGRAAQVGGVDIVRVLPTKGRRTVGAWCFVDLMGPVDAERPDPLEVGPHPHIGLSTVTWLLEGEALHQDSLGTEQVIRPGQLNWMTSGHGISHAELAAQPPFRGVQMWVAQPEGTRHGEARFEHHGELPEVDLDGASGTVLAGRVGDAVSPARTDTPLVGVDLQVRRGRTVVPTAGSFEHAVVPLDGRVKVGAEVVEPGWVALVPAGIDELPLEVHEDARLLVLGGEPLGERVEMWWNFVARDRDEITAAWRDWDRRTERFGDIDSQLERIEAPRPPWVPADR
ncbi:pirin family protein [Nitriliruptor alkaliphilus]|uniref:pirin family protein n=1 Tax=Nitriliruptor alkaliphilus TaxID=427918 RepID=UPI00069618C8|nr:pirin family protein [Nitriliruptor alkaliphilus]